MEPAIQKAESKLEYLSSDEETMSMYYAREKSLHDQANMVNSAEQRGRLEGKKAGIRQVAISLLDILDDETIAEKTGLMIEEVKRLRENN